MNISSLVFTGETPLIDNIFSALVAMTSGISTSVLEVHILDAESLSDPSFKAIGLPHILKKLCGSLFKSFMQLVHIKELIFNFPLESDEIFSVTFRTFEVYSFLVLSSWILTIFCFVHYYMILVKNYNL